MRHAAAANPGTRILTDVGSLQIPELTLRLRGR